jgi:nucleobase:cation symporter-1, NCS1 family
MSTPASTTRPGAIETHTIDFIPESERRGKAWHQFTLWFGANSVIVSIVTASILVAAGMSIVWSFAAILIGFALGSFFSAFHAAQGPQLGIPQMIQSRAQFGYVGGVVPMIVALLNYLVFFAAAPAICGELLQSLLGWNPFVVTIVVTLITFVVALFGYDLTHRIAKYLSVAAVVVFGIFTVLLIAHVGLPDAKPINLDAGFNPVLFFSGIAITFVYSAGYAPYIADYSRYLPSTTKVSATAWWTWGGIALSSIWLFVIGAYLVTITGFDQDVLGSVIKVTNGFTPVFTAVFVIVMIALQILQGSLSMYAGGNTLISIGTSLRSRRVPVVPSLRARLTGLVPFAIICLAAALLYTTAFVSVFTYALGVILILLIPWSAINLADFYLLRHGKYNIEAIFDPKGVYGRVNIAGLVAFIVGFVVELPFASLGFYEGPVAVALQGVDISWIVGIIVSAGVYLLLARRRSAAVPVDVPGVDTPELAE